MRSLKVGYFEGDRPAEERRAHEVLKDLGVKLVPIKLPEKYPFNPLRVILDTEASAAFDDLTRAGVHDGIGRTWGNTFRTGQFVPAIEYLRACRIRTLVMREMELVIHRYVDGYHWHGHRQNIIRRTRPRVFQYAVRSPAFACRCALRSRPPTGAVAESRQARSPR